MPASHNTAKVVRQLICARCGTEFGCGLSTDCWCAAELARLPLPSDASDCVCPSCLRKMTEPPTRAS